MTATYKFWAEKDEVSSKTSATPTLHYLAYSQAATFAETEWIFAAVG